MSSNPVLSVVDSVERARRREGAPLQVPYNNLKLNLLLTRKPVLNGCTMASVHNKMNRFGAEIPISKIWQASL